MLVLVCSTCQVPKMTCFILFSKLLLITLISLLMTSCQNVSAKSCKHFLLQDSNKEYVCELCLKNGKQCCEISVKQDYQAESELSEPSDIGKLSISNKISTSKAPGSNGKVCINSHLCHSDVWLFKILSSMPNLEVHMLCRQK